MPLGVLVPPPESSFRGLDVVSIKRTCKAHRLESHLDEGIHRCVQSVQCTKWQDTRANVSVREGGSAALISAPSSSHKEHVLFVGLLLGWFSRGAL